MSQPNPELQQFLDDYHFTKADLARQLGIDPKSLQRWKHKKRLTKLQRLALRGLVNELDEPMRLFGEQLGRHYNVVRNKILRSRTPWTEIDDRTLIELAAQKTPLGEIGKLLHRSTESVRCRLIRSTSGPCQLGRPPDQPWSQQELQIAIDLRVHGCSYQEIADRLDRPHPAVYRKVKSMLPSPKRRSKFHNDYDEDTDDVLKTAWENRDHDAEQIAATVGRSVKSVYGRASKLGLRRPKRKISLIDEWAYSRDELLSMNDKFCAAMRKAIKVGREVAPTEICTIPGTRNPIQWEHQPYLPIRRGVAGECADA